MIISSALESTGAVMRWEPEGNRSSPERVGLVDEAESVTELTSMHLVTGELWLLPGIDRRSVQAGRSTDRGPASVFSPSPPEKDGCSPAALAPDYPFSGGTPELFSKGAEGAAGRGPSLPLSGAQKTRPSGEKIYGVSHPGLFGGESEWLKGKDNWQNPSAQTDDERRTVSRVYSDTGSAGRE